MKKKFKLGELPMTWDEIGINSENILSPEDFNGDSRIIRDTRLEAVLGEYISDCTHYIPEDLC